MAIMRPELQIVRAVLQHGLRGAARPGRVRSVSVLPARVVVVQLAGHQRRVDREPARPGLLRPVPRRLPLQDRCPVLRQHHHHAAVIDAAYGYARGVV